MKPTLKALNEALAACTLAVQNTLASAEIQAIVAKEGYDAKSLENGLTLANQVMASLSSSASALGQQVESTRTLNNAMHEARSALTLFRKKARIVFADAGYEANRRLLSLDQTVPKSTNGLLTHGKTVFAAALSDASTTAVMSANGYSTERLQTLQTLFLSLESLNQKQELQKSVKQEATQVMKAQSEEFIRWWTGYRTTARLLLTSQQLTSLGIS